MINFYRRFIPNAAEHQTALHDALAGLKGSQPVNWNEDLDEAFIKCKKSLADATLLNHPDTESPLGLFTDASSTSVGACLQQFKDSSWQPLAFFSHKLNQKQKDWPAYYRELYAVYTAIQHFRHILQAQPFTIFTDHKPLTYAFQQKRDKLPPVQLNQLTFISQFTTDIQHISGSANIVADTMSRVEAITPSTPIDLHTLASAQKDDTELQDLLSGNTSLQLKLIDIPGSDEKVYCDVTLPTSRPYVPEKLRRSIFDSLHGLSHPGIKASVILVSKRFVWPSLRKDCRNWARSCQHCQRAKVTRYVHSPPGLFIQPSARFQHIHIDLIGPLPPADSYRYCLTVVDRFTRWPEVWPLRGITAKEVAEALVICWISRFGTPSRITSDQGRQFESDLFCRLGMSLGSNRHRTCSWHPCSNGMVERFHRQLKAAIMCHPETTWLQALPLVLLGIRSAFRPDLNASSAELVYGEPLRLPGELIVAPNDIHHQEDPSDFAVQLRCQMAKLRPTPGSSHRKPTTFIFQDLQTCSHVFLRDDTVRKSLQPPYTGPHQVVGRDEKTISIIINGKNSRVSIDRVKPAYILAEEPQKETKNPPKLCIKPPSVTQVPDTTRPTLLPTYTTRSGRQVRFKKP